MPLIFDHLISGTADADTLSDALVPDGDTVAILGRGGNDTLSTTGPSNLVNGGSGKDTITSLGGFVYGGGGADTIHMSGPGGRIEGGLGDDIITIDEAHLEPGAIFTIIGETLGQIPNYSLVVGNDTIIGSSAFERVYDGWGNDTVDLKAGGIIFADSRNIQGARIDDDIYIGSTADEDTNETVSYARVISDMELRFDDGATQGSVICGDTGNDTLIGIDRVITGSGNDQVYGNFAAYNAITTGRGDDYVQTGADVGVISLGAGDDTVFTGSGVYDIDAGIGRNAVFCGSGEETISFLPASTKTGATMTLGVDRFAPGTDKIRLDAGTDIAGFLATGYNGEFEGIDGVRFDISATKVLHFVGLTIDQLSVEDFLA